MNQNLLSSVLEFLRRKMWNKRWQRAVTCLAAVAVFGVTYALILPAITMTRDFPTLEAEETLAWTGDELVVRVRAENPEDEAGKAIVLTMEGEGADLSGSYVFNEEGICVITDDAERKIELHRSVREDRKNAVDYWFTLGANEETTFTLTLTDRVDPERFAEIVKAVKESTDEETEQAATASASNAVKKTASVKAVRNGNPSTASNASRASAANASASSADIAEANALAANPEEKILTEDEDGFVKILDGAVVNDLEPEEDEDGEPTEVVAELKISAGVGVDYAAAVTDAERNADKRTKDDVTAQLKLQWEDAVETQLVSEVNGATVAVFYNHRAAIPQNAGLSVRELEKGSEEYEAYLNQAKSAMTQAADGDTSKTVKQARFFDITILDENGEKVEPQSAVKVVITYDEAVPVEEDGDLNVLHFKEEAPEVIAPSKPEDGQAVDALSFTTDSFSIYGIVGMGTITYDYLTADGETYKITVNYGPEAGIPDNADLKVEELSGSAYEEYISRTAEMLDAEDFEYARVFDISIIGEDSMPVEPAAAVDVSIQLLDVENDASGVSVVHFSDRPEQMETRAEGDTVSFSTGSFSAYAIVKPVPGDLDNREYALMFWIEGTAGKALMAEAGEQEGYLKALSLTVLAKKTNFNDKLYVPANSDASMWKFQKTDDGTTYYLTSETAEGSETAKKYLSISSQGLALKDDPDESCKISVVEGTGNNKGKIFLKQGNNTLAYSGDVTKGYKVGGAAGSEYLYLTEKSTETQEYVMTHSAKKVSVSDTNITNGSRVIVYTRSWNDSTKKYEFYAIDQDGSLVRCYESGDNIEWVSGRLNSMLWSFVEYYWEGTTDPNYYYELYNLYSEKYIAPQKSNGQTLSDNTIGINMNGRRDGQYYTPIVAWDEGYYAYSGLKASADRKKIESCPLSEAEDFYFAIIEDLPADDALLEVPTVDHTQYGITMKMVNFGTDIYRGNDNTPRAAMRNFLEGINSASGDYKNGNTTPGLLLTHLGENGYPVTKAGKNLSEWFGSGEEQEVNHLFIKSTFEATGYYEFNSVENFAQLDENKENFIVYKQLSASASSGKFHEHGHFWPYNKIEAGKFSDKKNIYDALGKTLPGTDPRKNERLYAVQKNHTTFAPDYFFGMEITASFTQTPSGLDDWGHDIIYEFTGDDDFWLFVDGELIIDLGGVHDALAGSVNYKTGEVKVNGTTHTLKELFKSNFIKRHPKASDQEIAEFLNQYFEEGSEIFKDYSTHTMKIYYLERGAGASNLHTRFNLASVKPGTVQLTKKITGLKDSESVYAEFPYQILYKDKEGKARYLSNYVDKDPERMENHVFFKGTTTPVPYKKSLKVGDKTYNDVFLLEAGETADINFPEALVPETEDNSVDYSIIECGINPNVYDPVSANGEEIVGVAADASHKDYPIATASTAERARVEYTNNIISDRQSITITKRLLNVDGTEPLHFDKDKENTTFNFRLYLATEFGDLEAASMREYHVKDPGGYYCKWSVDDQMLVRLGEEEKYKTFNNEWTQEELEAATFHTSMNGSISKIPVDHTIEVRGLLAGTQYRVVERPTELPDGFTFRRYEFATTSDATKKEVSTDAAAGVTHILQKDTAPNLDVFNIKGYGLRVYKKWSDQEYMEKRDDTYFGIFEKDADGDIELKDGSKVKLVDGTLRPMSMRTETLYWYFQQLDEGKQFGDYIIFEVSLENPKAGEDGTITYTSLSLKEDGESIVLNGQQKDDNEKTYSYAVKYDERGELPTTGANVRVDKVTNKRADKSVKVYKEDWSRNKLKGATFQLKDSDKHTFITKTSGEDGFVTEAFLNKDTEYYLEEVTAPAKYHGVQKDIKVILKENGDLEVEAETEGYQAYLATSSDAEGSAVLTIKNKPYTFKVIKKDKGTKQPIPGIHFALYRQISVAGETSFDQDPYKGYENMVTDGDGVLTGLNENLPTGTYKLNEIIPFSKDYVQLPDETVVFTVTPAGAITLDKRNEYAELEVEDTNQQELAYTLSVFNRKKIYVSLWKTDEAYNALTKGADFSLYAKDQFNVEEGKPKAGAETVVTGTTGANGILALGQLTAGDYYLLETSAPEGYLKTGTPIKITVDDTVTDESIKPVSAFQEGNPSDVYVEGDPYYVIGQPEKTYQIRVWNNPGVELPHTGGSGTLKYTLGGLVLLITSALLYSFRRRRGERRPL